MNVNDFINVLPIVWVVADNRTAMIIGKEGSPVYSTQCPFCQKFSFKIHTKRNVYGCTCINKMGGCIDFIVRLKGFSPEDAISYLYEKYGKDVEWRIEIGAKVA
jgi:hypothetical protein